MKENKRLFVSVEGPIKPYVRMTRRSMYVDDQAQEYLASKTALQTQLRAWMSLHEYEPLGREPLRVEILFGWANHRQDLDNLAKAVLDACNGIVWDDDRWVDDLQVRRWMGGRNPVWLWLWVERLEEGAI